MASSQASPKTQKQYGRTWAKAKAPMNNPKVSTHILAEIITPKVIKVLQMTALLINLFPAFYPKGPKIV